MAVRHSPSATAGLRQGILVNVKARISVGILDKRQNMLEQFFLSLCFLARSTGAAFRSQKVHPVHMESHRTQDNVHTLLDGMLVRIYFRDVPGLYDYLGIMKERKLLQIVQVRLEIIVLGARIRNFVKEQLDFGRTRRIVPVISQTKSVLDELVIQKMVLPRLRKR